MIRFNPVRVPILSLLTSVCLLTLAAVSHATQVPPIEGEAIQENTHMRIEFAIDQGTTHDYAGSRLGFNDSYAPDEASVSVWDDAEQAWSSRFDLRQGDIFPAGGHFLRLYRLDTGEQGTRAKVELGEVTDVGGINAVQPTNPVLPAKGRLEFGLTRLELSVVESNERAELDMWPKSHPRDRTDPEDVVHVVLAIGQMLEFGNKTIRVVRIQPAAGEIVAFVEFEVMH